MKEFYIQEANNYRSTCLICQRPLEYAISGGGGKDKDDSVGIFEATRTDTYLKLHDKENNIYCQLNYDNTYKLSKNWYKYYDDFSMITKMCPNCNIANETAISAGGSLKIATLANPEYYYSFGLGINKAEKVYFLWNGDELLRRMSSENIIQLRSIMWERTQIEFGLISQSIQEIGKIKLPFVDTSSIKSLDDFEKKVKMYLTFS